MKNKLIFKIISFIIIQTYLMLNLSCGFSKEITLAKNHDSLSPNITINSQNITFLFEQICTEQTNIALKNTPDKKTPPSIKRKRFPPQFNTIINYLAAILSAGSGFLVYSSFANHKFKLLNYQGEDIILLMLFMPVAVTYLTGTIITIHDYFRGSIKILFKYLYSHIKHFFICKINYQIFLISCFLDHKFRKNYEEILGVIFSHPDDGVLVNSIKRQFPAKNTDKIIKKLEQMDIIKITNNASIDANLFHREYFYYVLKTIRDQLKLQMPDRELFAVSALFREKSIFSGLRENLILSLPILIIFTARLILEGSGIAVGKMFSELIMFGMVVQMLINMSVNFVNLLKTNSGAMNPISGTVLISRYNQFSMFEEAMLKAFNDGEIPDNAYIKSRESIIGTIHHESIHAVLFRYLGSRHNIKLTNTIEHLLLDSQNIKAINFKGAKTAQIKGDVLELIEKGKSIENSKLTHKEKLGLVRKTAFNYANHNRGNFAEPAWFYCYGYILYGMLKEKTQTYGNFTESWKIVLELLNPKNFAQEKQAEKQKNKESLLMPVIRITAAILSAFGAYAFLSFLNSQPANTALANYEAIFLDFTLLSLITLIGWLSGQLLSIFKGDTIAEYFHTSLKKLKLKKREPIKKSRPEHEAIIVEEKSEKEITLKKKWSDFIRLGLAKQIIKAPLTQKVQNNKKFISKDHLSRILPQTFKPTTDKLIPDNIIFQSI